jgi:putative SOS response-associated peptidase YedK
MCGRFTLRAPAAAVAKEFGLFDVPELSPHFNICPSQSVVIVRQRSEAEGRELAFVHWGLIPSWAEDPKIGNRMANARSETAATKPSFRSAFKSRRCLIIADGFYEWQKTDGGKQPYLIGMKDGRPFGMAGLWERWEKGEEPVESCAILTTGANELMEPIHERMPVILSPKQFDLWLDPKCQDSGKLAGLMQPYQAKDMLAYAVSIRVNNPKNDTADCIEPMK